MGNLVLSRPEASEYASSYEPYIRLVPEGDILTLLERQIEDTIALLHDLSETEAETRHAPYTWSIKEVVGHLLDAERIFGIRALRFARNDPTALPGFEENDYVRNAHFDRRRLENLVREFELVRRSHLLFFGGLDDETWRRSGVANGNLVTVRALAYIIAGHERHHMTIVRKRLSS
jgi:hypothetical protein